MSDDDTISRIESVLAVAPPEAFWMLGVTRLDVSTLLDRLKAAEAENKKPREINSGLCHEHNALLIEGANFEREIVRLRAELAEAKRDDEALEVLRLALDALTCGDTGDDLEDSHRCGKCDEYVDRNAVTRQRIRTLLNTRGAA